MRGVGFCLIGIGILGLIVALNTDTTVDIDFPSQTIGSVDLSRIISPQKVHNYGLMLRQLEWVIISGLVVLCGVVFYGFGEIMERTKPTRQIAYRTKSSPRSPTEPEMDDFTRLCNGESLPPKFDERGRPLQPTIANLLHGE